MPGYRGGTAAADLARLRLFVAESGTVPYADNLLVSIIAGYPLPDAAGEWPTLTSGSANTDWTPAYDLASAAAEIWDNKAAAIAGNFDFTADGATFNKQQVYVHHVQQARKWRSRRAMGSHEMVVFPTQPQTSVWIGNINDPYE